MLPRTLKVFPIEQLRKKHNRRERQSWTFLSNQLTTVKAVAILYVSLDAIICTQYIYFRFFGPNGSCKDKNTETNFLKDQLLDPEVDYTQPLGSPVSDTSYQPPDQSQQVFAEDGQQATDNERQQVHGFILPVLLGLQFFMSCSVGYNMINQQES